MLRSSWDNIQKKEANDDSFMTIHVDETHKNNGYTFQKKTPIMKECQPRNGSSVIFF